MINMLEQAVIDAAALKEAAVKNAETIILEKYSSEIKDAVDSILEQPEDEDLGLSIGVGDEPKSEIDPLAQKLPLAATDGEKVCPCPEEDEEIEIDFDELEQAMHDEEDDLSALDVGPETELEEASSSDKMAEVPAYLASDLHLYHYGMGDAIYKVGSLAYAGKPVPLDLLEEAITNLEQTMDKMTDEKDLEQIEDLIYQLHEIANESVLGPIKQAPDNKMTTDDLSLEGITEDVIDNIMETLEVDCKNVPHGWMTHGTESEQDEAVEVALAASQDDKIKEETKELKKALENIAVLKEQLTQSHKRVKSLSTAYNSVKSIAEEASKKLEEMSITNAKLFYQNRILESVSLNEQQKLKLVEAISKVDSVEKAKIAYETLQQTLVEGKVSQKSNHISEVVSRSNVLNLNQQQRKAEDPWKQRNQVLAGIKRIKNI